MVIDKEVHRKFLHDVLTQINIPGQHARLLVEVLTAVELATVATPDPHQRGHD